MSVIEVKKQPVDPGPAAWNDLLEPADPPQELSENIKADWVIVGAGFAGLSAARRVSQLCPTDRIVVLDARRVAEGPAGRNSGFMIDLPHDLSSSDYGGALDHDVTLTSDNRYAIDFAAQMAEDFGLGADVFARSGKINGAATAKGDAHNRDYAKHLDAMGEPYQMYDAAKMQSITGSQYYQSGLFTAGTAMIQPAAFVRGVAGGLSSNRLQIYENSPVLGLERKNDWVAKTPNATVTSPRVILAVNGHLNSFGFLKNRLMHVFTYASMTHPLTQDQIARLGGDDIWGLTPADPMGTTVRRIISADGVRIIIRNRFTFDPEMEVTDKRIASVGQNHDRSFQARFPMLPDVKMQHRWGGRLCMSRNNTSVVGELEKGLYAACCQNGLGTTRGTLSGILAVDLATDTKSDRLTRATSADFPPRLPPALMSKVGASAVLKWQEMKAGAEL